MFRRCRRCCYMNSCNNISNDMLETKCNNVQNCCSCSKNSCDCGFDEEDNVFPTTPMFAQSYVPWQTMDKTFLPSVGLKMGTIFPELVSPYMPGQSMEEIEFIRNANIIGKGCNK